MSEYLARLLKLYEALQDCPPHEQARHQTAFKDAGQEVATAHGLYHWHVSAHVVRQWDIMCQRENRRKGLGPPSVDRSAGI